MDEKENDAVSQVSIPMCVPAEQHRGGRGVLLGQHDGPPHPAGHRGDPRPDGGGHPLQGSGKQGHW